METPRIQVLPHEVVEQIAAGEVVERPASVVKELVENSLDAGARRVRIETEGGGKALLRVVDNGFGMTPEEAELALLRHATSKLRTAADLFNIRTLGFRGEALPSIASVSDLEIITRREDVAEGARVVVSGGRLVTREPAAAPVGTTITVSRLFFNVPARQKFLKSDTAEANEITRLVQRLALSHPGTAFLLSHDGREALRSPGSDDPLNAVVALLGRGIARELLRVPPTGDEKLRVSGFVGLPTLTRASRDHQLFFVNGRPIRSPLFYRAVDDAYRSRMPGGRHAVALLFLEVDPANVDVNVHPSKIEVRFHDEPGLHAALYRAIDRTLAASAVSEPAEAAEQFGSGGLGGYGSMGAAGLPHSPAPPGEVREAPPGFVPPPGVPLPADFPFARAAMQPGEAPPWPRRSPGDSRPGQPESPAGPEDPFLEPVAGPEAPPQPVPAPPLADLQLLGQAHDLFILAEEGGRLWIIDQHVAHERILFDRLTAAGQTDAPVAAPGVAEPTPASAFESSPGPPAEVGQALLVPLTLALDARQLLAVTEHADLLAELGFAIEPFGAGRVLVRSVPRSLVGRSYEPALRDMIDELTELSSGGQVRLRKEQLALAAAGRACKAAVKAGMPLTPEEMARLLADLRRTRDPYTCPHGRPVFLVYDQEEIARLFGPRRCD